MIGLSFIPVFEHGLILKKHMLEAIRDYPIEFVNNLFSDYGDGIILGLKVNINENNSFEISEGIIKLDGIVYFVKRSEKIEFREQRNFVYLSIIEEKYVDGSDFSVDIIHTDKEMPGLFELFRYVKNANMKKYEDVYELFGEVTNRIDQRNMHQSVLGGYSLSEDYYVLFANKILQATNSEIKDVAFAYQCLNGITNIEIVKSYFGTQDYNNATIITNMKKILDEFDIKHDEERTEEIKEHETEQISVYI